jgi:carboxyl-terminal processing protease
MNRSRLVFLALSLALLAPLAAGVLWSATAADNAKPDGDSMYKYLSIFSEVFGLVRDDYVDETDPANLVAGAMEGVTDALDAFSFFVPAQADAGFDRALAIGRSRSGVTLAHDHGMVYALGIEAGSPAASAGLAAGDLIADVDGQSTRDLPAWRLESLFSGEPGTKLALKILRQGDTKEIALTLADYAPPAPSLEQVGGLPVLHLPSFGPATAGRARELVQDLVGRHADKLLLDLRGVAGGSADAAFEVAGLLAGGELGRLADRRQTLREFKADAPPLWSGELVVLVDGATEGAAEALAAALRGRSGVRLVGTRTFGWAGERSFVEMTGGARLLVTTAFYAGPDGAPIAKGLAPDVLVDDLQRNYLERDKPLSEIILERGIELLSGAPPARQAA